MIFHIFDHFNHLSKHNFGFHIIINFKEFSYDFDKILEQKITSLDIAKIFFIFVHYIPYFVEYIDIRDKISAV